MQNCKLIFIKETFFGPLSFFFLNLLNLFNLFFLNIQYIYLKLHPRATINYSGTF